MRKNWVFLREKYLETFLGEIKMKKVNLELGQMMI
jgi:hypothetical protein